MTVRELIEKLQAFDGDLPVVTIDSEFGYVDDVEALRIDQTVEASSDGSEEALAGEGLTGAPRRRVVVIS